MNIEQSKKMHKLAREMFAADQLKLPALERIDWEGEALIAKLTYQKLAEKTLRDAGNW